MWNATHPVRKRNILLTTFPCARVRKTFGTLGNVRVWRRVHTFVSDTGVWPQRTRLLRFSSLIFAVRRRFFRFWAADGVFRRLLSKFDIVPGGWWNCKAASRETDGKKEAAARRTFSSAETRTHKPIPAVPGKGKSNESKPKKSEIVDATRIDRSVQVPRLEANDRDEGDVPIAFARTLSRLPTSSRRPRGSLARPKSSRSSSSSFRTSKRFSVWFSAPTTSTSDGYTIGSLSCFIGRCSSSSLSRMSTFSPELRRLKIRQSRRLERVNIFSLRVWYGCFFSGRSEICVASVWLPRAASVADDEYAGEALSLLCQSLEDGESVEVRTTSGWNWNQRRRIWGNIWKVLPI